LGNFDFYLLAEESKTGIVMEDLQGCFGFFQVEFLSFESKDF